MCPLQKYKNLGRDYSVGRNQYPGGFRGYVDPAISGAFYHKGENYEAWKDGNSKYQIGPPASDKKFYYE